MNFGLLAPAFCLEDETRGAPPHECDPACNAAFDVVCLGSVVAQDKARAGWDAVTLVRVGLCESEVVVVVGLDLIE